MTNDLSKHHQPLGDLFAWPTAALEWNRYRLSAEQIESYKTNGYLAGIRLLTDNQVEVLRGELEQLADPTSASSQLFYEYHSNESIDPLKTLFHALGAWRVATGFHDLLWNPAFLVPASQLLRGPVRFWHDQIFYKPAHRGGVAPGIRIILTGRGLSPWPISPAGSPLTIQRARTAAFITFREASAGTCSPLQA
jgi:hypothetical protein